MERGGRASPASIKGIKAGGSGSGNPATLARSAASQLTETGASRPLLGGQSKPAACSTPPLVCSQIKLSGGLICI